MTGIFPAEGRNLSARRERARADDALAHEWGFLAGQPSHPHNRASADPSGKPWSERKS